MEFYIDEAIKSILSQTYQQFELIIIEDGSTISMNDAEDWDELKAWHEANPNLEKPTLEFPVDITYKDGTTHIINNDDEMGNAKEDCGD